MAYHIVLGVDGTGSSEWRNSTGSNSSVSRFIQDFHIEKGEGFKTYLDGPGNVISGSDSPDILDKGLDFIKWSVATLYGIHSNPSLKMDYDPLVTSINFGKACFMPVPAGFVSQNIKIVLVGHSRGGLIVVKLAERLANENPPMKVEYMGLYDAVDRTASLKGVDPVNVDTVYHAVRNPMVGSRSYFGNTARATNSTTANYNEQKFFTSHGGIGGDVQTRYVIGQDNSCASISIDVVPMAGTLVPVIRDNSQIMKNCIYNARSADRYIRSGAMAAGLPIE